MADQLDVAMAGIRDGWRLQRVERLEAGNGRWRAILWKDRELGLPVYHGGDTIIGVGRDIPAAIRAAVFLAWRHEMLPTGAIDF